MLRKMEDFQWDTISSGTSCPNEMINNFYNKIWPIYEECFPIIKTRVSSRDPPFLSPIVKHLLKLRKNAINLTREITRAVIAYKKGLINSFGAINSKQLNKKIRTKIVDLKDGGH